MKVQLTQSEIRELINLGVKFVDELPEDLMDAESKAEIHTNSISAIDEKGAISNKGFMFVKNENGISIDISEELIMDVADLMFNPIVIKIARWVKSTYTLVKGIAKDIIKPVSERLGKKYGELERLSSENETVSDEAKENKAESENSDPKPEPLTGEELKHLRLILKRDAKDIQLCEKISKGIENADKHFEEMKKNNFKDVFKYEEVADDNESKTPETPNDDDDHPFH